MVDEFADTKQDIGSEPATGGSKPEKSVDTGAQVIAAIVVVVGLAGALWVLGGGRDAAGDTKPAVCDTTHDAKSSKHISAAQLCTALNRSDLPTLLGTPDEQAISASGNVSTFTSADGTKTDSPEADVDLKTYSLELTASDDDFPVSELADFLGGTVQKRSFLGHPAVLYSDHTTALRFNLGGGKVHTGPGGIARTLIVAKDAKDGGGSFEVSIWRQDFATPDDAALFRVAEKVLPSVPGWTAG
jgi:hypothetical protein